MDGILDVAGLSKTFTLHERGATLCAFEDVSFSLGAGSFSALVAPSGSGKSSLLKCIYRTYLASAGSATFRSQHGDVNLVSADEHAIIELRRREIGYVSQFLHCLPRQSCLDVVARPLIALGANRVEARARASEMLEALGLPAHLLELPPATFSGGEKQRVNLARGLLTGPRLLLLDEPTASLDAQSAERAVEQITQARNRGAAILAILHDSSLVRRLADQTIALRAPVGARTEN
ncbi:MAG: ATP-binding cassette domain-containing protein [Planctomycetes bacterium]|nr:ATP-binding cassette domain-containing protein [Planctomycetota bacterium]